jgi:hypothetical protein
VPVIAVPTSVGYGAAFGGLAPLLTMLNACSPGVGVVNIDNGFGAAVLAGTLRGPPHSVRGGILLALTPVDVVLQLAFSRTPELQPLHTSDVAGSGR